MLGFPPVLSVISCGDLYNLIRRLHVCEFSQAFFVRQGQSVMRKAPRTQQSLPGFGTLWDYGRRILCRRQRQFFVLGFFIIGIHLIKRFESQMFGIPTSPLRLHPLSTTPKFSGRTREFPIPERPNDNQESREMAWNVQNAQQRRWAAEERKAAKQKQQTEQKWLPESSSEE
jgi:hypothetical protein